MLKLLLPIATAVLLAGCVSDQEMLQRQAEMQARQNAMLAACHKGKPTNLAATKCEYAVLAATSAPSSPGEQDLVGLAEAKREDIAARLDRRQITQEQANLEWAEFRTQVTNERGRRQIADNQNRLAQAQMIAALRPPQQIVINNSNTNTVAVGCNGPLNCY